MSNYTHFNLSYDDAGVAWMSMDAAGRSVNVLAQEVMAEERAHQQKLEALEAKASAAIHALEQRHEQATL